MVCLYSKTETNFTHNGICVLDPSVCTVEEHARGSYELYIEHPYDGRHELIAEDMIIKAPVPPTTIQAITLPARTKYTVATVSDFIKKFAVLKNKKEVDSLAAVRANPQYYQYASSRGFNSGAYCIYNDGIYVATDFTMNETPGTGRSWRWVAPLYQSGGGSSSGAQYTSAEIITPALTVGAYVNQLATYNGEYVQIKDTLGRVGYYLKSNLHVEEQEAETIPEQTITEQLFRVYAIDSEEETHILKVYARHISYDFAGNKLMDCKIEETKTNDAIAVLQGSLMIPDDRKIVCQFDTETISKDYSFKNPINALLDPDDGIAATLKAMVIRNNADFYILRNDTPRKGITIEYGVNLKGVNWHRSSEEAISRVVPRCNTSGDDYLYLEHGGTWDSNGNWMQNNDIFVDSPIASSFPFPKIQILDCQYSVGEKYTPAGATEETTRTEESCRQQMLKDAQERFTKDHCDGRDITLQVEFLLIGDTEQYKQYKGLQRVNLYDEITIKTEAYTATAQVTEYKYDSLLKRYIDITVGQVGSFDKRVPGYRVMKESITYAKLSPDLISRIRTMNTPTGDSSGSGGGSSTPMGGDNIVTGVTDDLTSSSTTDALSANQGRILNNKTVPVDKTSGVTFDTNYVDSGQYFRLYKTGRVAYVSGYVQFKSNTSVPVDTTIITLPTDCKPIEDWTLIAQRPTTGDANQARVMIVKANGQVQLHNGSPITGGYLRFTGCFITAE